MLPNRLPDAVLILTYELAYLVFRVAGQLEQNDLKKTMKAKAVFVLDLVLSGKKDLLGEEIFKLKIYSSFINDAGLISFSSFSSLMEKLRKMEEELEKISFEFKEEEKEVEKPSFYLGIEDILKNEGKEREKNSGLASVLRKEGDDYFSKNINVSSANSSAVRQDIEFGNNSANIIDDNASRKKNVFEEIKSRKICFLKDLMDVFPDYKERTIRYNLENLVKERKVEKVGTSGPGTFYRVILE